MELWHSASGQQQWQVSGKQLGPVSPPEHTPSTCLHCDWLHGSSVKGAHAVQEAFYCGGSSLFTTIREGAWCTRSFERSSGALKHWSLN